MTVEDTNLDYKKDNIPILIGKDLKESFDIGDIIKTRNYATINDLGEVSLEVVGIMDNHAIPSTKFYGDAFASSMFFGNGFTVIPTVDNFISLSYGAAIGDAGAILELAEGVKVDTIKKILNENFNKLEFKVEISSLGKLNNMILSLHKDHKASLVLGAFLWILAIIGTTCLLLGIIKKRKKEFAIKLTVGASIEDIISEFRKEVLYINIISSCLAIVISIGSMPSIPILLMNILGVTMMTFAITYLPIKYLKCMDLIEIFR